jgi:hypothetical protein
MYYIFTVSLYGNINIDITVYKFSQNKIDWFLGKQHSIRQGGTSYYSHLFIYLYCLKLVSIDQKKLMAHGLYLNLSYLS